MKLLETLQKMAELSIEISTVEDNLKEKKRVFNELESQASAEMIENSIDKITVAGIEFSHALPAFKIAGDESSAFDWLKNQGYENAIKRSRETVNYQTLSKILRDRMESDGIESIPYELFTCVNTGKLKLRRQKEI